MEGLRAGTALIAVALDCSLNFGMTLEISGIGHHHIIVLFVDFRVIESKIYAALNRVCYRGMCRRGLLPRLAGAGACIGILGKFRDLIVRRRRYHRRRGSACGGGLPRRFFLRRSLLLGHFNLLDCHLLP